MSSIAIIAAMSRNYVIGKNNTLPWHMPADLKHFKNITMGKTIIMGRKTFESIGKPLPGRQSIILTRDEHYQAPGCVVLQSLENLKSVTDAPEIFVIGGSEIYKQLIPRAQKLYLTYIDAIIDGDSFFPTWQKNQWHEISREDHLADEVNKYNYSFVVYEKS